MIQRYPHSSLFSILIAIFFFVILTLMGRLVIAAEGSLSSWRPIANNAKNSSDMILVEALVAVDQTASKKTLSLNTVEKNPQASKQALDILNKTEPHSPEDLYLLGVLYREGKHIPKNYVESYNFFVKSAEGGNKTAYFALGYAHDQGLGVEQDFDKALEFYLYAAEQFQNVEAMLRLGEMYALGIGTEVRYDQALYYYERLVNRTNHPIAKERYAKILEIYQLEEKVRKGNEKEAYQLAMRYFIGDDVVPLDKKRALELLADAAHYDSNEANFMLGKLHQKGEDLPLDHQTAYLHFSDAADKGHIGATFEVARYLLEKTIKGANRDEDAEKMLSNAVHAGYTEAQRYQAVRYDEKKRYQEAHALYQRLMEKGDIEATLALAQYALLGKGFSPDPLAAKQLLMNIVNNDHQDKFAEIVRGKAFYYLGIIVEENLTNQRDINVAFAFFSESLLHHCEETLTYLRGLEAKKSPYAPFLLASACQDDEQKRISAVERLALYKEAADHGFALAQVSIILDEGSLSEQYFQRLLENPQAGKIQRYLGRYFLKSLNHKEKSLQLYEASGANGVYGAYAELGQLYHYGDKKIGKDFIQAEKFYQLALKSEDVSLKDAVNRELKALREAPKELKKSADETEKLKTSNKIEKSSEIEKSRKKENKKQH